MIARAPSLSALIAAAAAAAAVIVAAAAWLLAPSDGERLGAALPVGDRSAMASLSGGVAQQGAIGAHGTAMLLARSQLAAGDVDAALATLAPVAAARPDDPAVVALADRALVAAGRHTARLRLLRDEALRRPTPRALRRWQALAQAAADPGEERAALERLAQTGAATGAEIERLAFLDVARGDPAAARTRLAAWQAAGGTLSTDAMQRLLHLSLERADAATLAALLGELSLRHAPPTCVTVIDDLVARGRPATALALIDAAPAAEAPALWRRKVELHRAARDDVGARALLMQATTRPGVAPPGDVVALAYGLKDESAILRAAEHGAIPPPDAALALDLVRRWRSQPALVARLERIAGTGWRRRAPDLAVEQAVAAHDEAAALAAVALVPEQRRDARREDVLTRFGDRVGLRTQWLDHARRDPSRRAEIAEQLLTIGARADATGILQEIAQAPDDRATLRLLYLWGPRPGAAAVAWLRQRAAEAPDRGTAARWLSLAAHRAPPRAALAALERDPLGTRTDVLLIRLDLATTLGDAGAANRALRLLLDGRALGDAELAQASGAALPGIDPALRLALTRRRVAADRADAGDRMDLAWAAWNARDVPGARAALTAQLAAHPDDVAALTLMADVEVRSGAPSRARRWLTRAWAAGSGDSRARATLLARLDRRAEAQAMIHRLRAAAPDDGSLLADEARLLIADGHAGAAQALLAR